MRKTLVLFFMFMAFCVPVFASASITINNVDKKEVADYILSTVMQQHQNVIVESANDYSIVLLATTTENTGLFGQYTYTRENRIGITFVQQATDTLLSVSQTCTVTEPNGRRSVMPVGTVTTELPMLQKVKGYFNGLYMFGYNTNEKKENGGFVISEVTAGGAFDQAGIKAGDILMSINGDLVKKQKEKFVAGGFGDFSRQQITSFVIKRDKVEKTYVITSQYIPSQYKKTEAPVPVKVN